MAPTAASAHRAARREAGRERIKEAKQWTKMKEEQQARIAAVRQAAAEAQMLGDVIRLAGYM